MLPATGLCAAMARLARCLLAPLTGTHAWNPIRPCGTVQITTFLGTQGNRRCIRATRSPALRRARAARSVTPSWGGNVLALPELIVAASLLSPHFLELRNFMNVLRGASVLCVVALGMTLVILSRGVDLSAGSILGMAGATLALVAALDAKLAIAAALAMGAAIGVVNGVLIACLGPQPFIATVATLIATRGLVYVVSDGAKRRCDRPPRTHAPGCD